MHFNTFRRWSINFDHCFINVLAAFYFALKLNGNIFRACFIWVHLKNGTLLDRVL